MEKKLLIVRTSNDILQHYGVKGMKWGVRRKGSALTKTSEEKSAERRRNIKVAAGVTAGAVAVLGTVVIAKHYNVPVKKLPGTMLNSVQKTIAKYDQQSIANQKSLESLNRIQKETRAQASSIKASSKSAGAAVRGMNRKPTIKNPNSGKTLKDLYAKTDRFAKLLEQGKLTPGQSKEWESVNDAMIEIFKKDNPYM